MFGVGIGLIIIGVFSFIFGLIGGDGGYAALYLIPIVIGVVLTIIGLIRKKSKNNSERKSHFSCKFDNLTEFQTNARNILVRKGYRPKKNNNDHVWEKKAFGASIYTYIKIKYNNNTANISGWIVGPGGEQMTLDGFIGIVYKLPAKWTIKKIVNLGVKD